MVKANPPSLLSTVQYVESFYGNRLGGEDQYWWMQLVAGIKKILLETRIYIRDPDKSFGNSIEISLSRLFFILLPKFWFIWWFLKWRVPKKSYKLLKDHGIQTQLKKKEERPLVKIGSFFKNPFFGWIITNLQFTHIGSSTSEEN